LLLNSSSHILPRSNPIPRQAPATIKEGGTSTWHTPRLWGGSHRQSRHAVQEPPRDTMPAAAENSESSGTVPTNPLRISHKAKHSRNSAMQRKVTVSVFIIVGCYLLFTVPLFITGLVHWIPSHPIDIPMKLAITTHWLFVGKSACNPILFASLNPQIQSGFKELVSFFKRKRS